MEPTFFRTPAELRAWFERNHETETELWVGFRRKSSGLPGITWSEAVDEALCFGWIDGVRKGVDDASYANRFTPRKPSSNWSRVNIAKVAALTAEGRMRPAGVAAWERRSEERSGVYSHENRERAALDPEQEREFRRNAPAWEFFEQQPPSYRKTAIWWVVSAKREDTRRRRLATLVEDSAAGRRLRQFTRPG